MPETTSINSYWAEVLEKICYRKKDIRRLKDANSPMHPRNVAS